MNLFNRRKFNSCLTASILGIAGTGFAQEKVASVIHAKLDDPTKKAIAKALAFIATKQNPD
ncbi:MAG: hypothetical protein ACOYNM_11145, partial [Gemmataceae bacterium]